MAEMKMRCRRHRVFWKRGGLQRPCPDFDQHCVVCQYFRRKPAPLIKR